MRLWKHVEQFHYRTNFKNKTLNSKSLQFTGNLYTTLAALEREKMVIIIVIIGVSILTKRLISANIYVYI